VLIRNPSVTWIVTGGDDVYPDPAWHPEDIAHRCEQRFAGTFGVMQPGGQSGDDNPDQWAVSPWIGREWIEQAYSSPQALSEHYFHYFTDAELTAAARRLGVYWFWKDVSQLHDSWRTRGDRTPPHLQKAMEEYPKDRETFLLRQELKFPGLQHRAGLV
jgi:GT2 family glycosyltransferase